MKGLLVAILGAFASWVICGGKKRHITYDK